LHRLNNQRPAHFAAGPFSLINDAIAVRLPLAETRLSDIQFEEITSLTVDATTLEVLQKPIDYCHGAAATTPNVQHESVANLVTAHVKLNGKVTAVKDAPGWIFEIGIRQNLPDAGNQFGPWPEQAGLEIFGHVCNGLRVCRNVLD
jgi:hypothetical protein